MVRRSVLAAGSVVALFVACYGATSVRVELTTDFACSEVAMKAALFVGTDDSGEGTVSELPCEAGTTASALGSIVVVPNSARDAKFTLTAVLATWQNGGPPKDPHACFTDPKDCVFARRTVSFFEHQERPVPIRLYRACVNRAACDGTGTCVPEASGTSPSTCVSSDIDTTSVDTCLDPATCDASAPPIPTPSVDASPDVVVDAVAPAPCTGPKGDGILARTIKAPGGGGLKPPLVVSNGRVWWITNRGLANVSIADGVVTIDAVALSTGGSALPPTSIAPSLGAAELLAATHGILFSVAKTGPTQLSDVPGDPIFATDGERTFVVSGNIFSVSENPPGSAPRNPALQDVGALAVTKTALFFLQGSELKKLVADNNGPQPFGTNLVFHDIASRPEKFIVSADESGAHLVRSVDATAGTYGAAGAVLEDSPNDTFENVAFDPAGNPYWVRRDANMQLAKIRRRTSSGGVIRSEDFDPTSYTSIVGPAFDDTCAYYWASTLGGDGDILVRPR